MKTAAALVVLLANIMGTNIVLLGGTGARGIYAGVEAVFKVPAWHILYYINIFMDL